MQIYLHAFGALRPGATKLFLKGDNTFRLLPWLGRDDDDAMENFRRYAISAGVDASTHRQMAVITDQVTPHLDLIRTLDPHATFRPESLYACVHSFGGEGAEFYIARAIDADAAADHFMAGETTYKGTRETAEYGLRGVVNLGEPLGYLKAKIDQYFGVPA